MLLFAAGCTTPPATPPLPVERVTLLGFNDFHGNLEPPGGTVPVLADGRVVRVPAGGAAYLATLIRSVQASTPNTVVVAAGDLIGASPFVSAAFHDEATVDVLGVMGLQISSVGNHEFDKGRSELLRMQHGGCAQPDDFSRRGVVGVDTCMTEGRFAGAKYQYLAANVIDTASGQPLFPAYVIKTFGSAKLAFIGLTLKDTPLVVTPRGVAGLRFEAEAPTINALVPELKRAGAQAIVVLIHQGGESSASFANDTRCPGFRGDILAITDALDPAIDVVISGHTHQEYVCTRPNGLLLTSAGFYGRFLTQVDLVIDPNSGRVVSKTMQNRAVVNDQVLRDASGQPVALPAGLAALAPDPQVRALVASYAHLTQPLQNALVGKLSASLSRDAGDSGESTLGNAVADAYLAATAGSEFGSAQVAFTNRGGLRAELVYDAAQQGDVRYGQLYSVLPFANTLVSMDLSGAQLYRLLEQQWEMLAPGTADTFRVLQVSGSFSYRWDARQPAGAGAGKGQRVVPGSVSINGVPVIPEAVYRVTVNSFMATGGDGYTVLNQGTKRQEGLLDVEAFERYLKDKRLPLPQAAPRISRVTALLPLLPSTTSLKPPMLKPVRYTRAASTAYFRFTSSSNISSASACMNQS